MPATPELAAVIATFAEQLVMSVENDLLARINNAFDPDVVDLVCSFASECRELGDGRDLVLALDDGANLEDSDRHYLADLTSVLPDGVVLRVAFSTWNAATRDAADDLVQRGVTCVELEGLGERAIADWLEAVALPRQWAERIRDVTNGYALHVAAAVELLASGAPIGELDRMERPDVLGAATRRTWRELDAVAKAAAESLCPFPAAISPETAAVYLGIDVAIWYTLRELLVDSRVFTDHSPWFHELRRRYIWSEILEDDQREEILDRAIRQIEDQLALPGATPEVFVQYALLMGKSRLAEQDPAAAAVRASLDEVAVMAAIIELHEPANPGLNAETVLLYAHEFFGATGNLVPALQGLAESGFVHLASSPIATAVVPTFSSAEPVRVFAGRAAAELGRLPTPALASSVFNRELRARLGPFRRGGLGLGTPRIWKLSEMAARSQQLQADGTRVIGKRGPNLLLRYHYDDLPLYAALAYDDEAERDNATRTLAGSTMVHGDHKLTIDECIVDPRTCLPSRRFFMAMDRLLGTDIAASSVGRKARLPKVTAPLSLDEEMRQRAMTLDAVRSLCSPEELLAYSLDEPIGYVYRGTERETETIQVLGRSGSSRLVPSVLMTSRSPLYRFELSRLLGLGSGERLGRVEWKLRAEQDHPVLAELTWIFQEMAKYNEHQRRVVFKLSKAALEDAIAETSARASRDAMEIAAVVGIEVPHAALEERALRGGVTHVVLQLDEPDPGWSPAAHATVIVATVPDVTGRHTANVQLVDYAKPRPIPGTDYEAVKAEFAERCEISPADFHQMTIRGAAIDVLAELLAYRTSEVRFEY